MSNYDIRDSLLIEMADSGHDSLARLIIESNRTEYLQLLTDSDAWPSIHYYNPDDHAISVDIVNTEIDGWRRNIIERYSDAISHTVKFPVNTAMLHGMGCVSSAMCRQFSYSIYGDKQEPTNLFVVSAQPPSTGKSGINGYWMDPIRIAFKGLNKAREKEKYALDEQLSALKNELKSAPDAGKHMLISEIADKNEKSESLNPLKVTLDDATPEALEKQMGMQEGWCNIVSDETDAVNIMLGFAYGDSASKKTNHGVFLKMYSGEWHSSSRITRDGFEGYIRGSFAVLAQGEAVEQILLAGESGRGISERILLMREPHMLGTRNMLEYTPIPDDIRADYANTINNIVNEPQTLLRFNHHAVKELAMFRNEIESQMGDNGRYSDNMTRGAMGKADKQVCKIASVLWVASEWSPNGSKRKEIGKKTMQRAIEIFKELSRTYLKETESRGYSGDAPKIKVVLDYLKRKLGKDIKEANAKKTYPHVTFDLVCNSIRSRKEFSGCKVPEVLREVIIPKLESDGFIIRTRNKIYISHKLLD